MKPKVFIGSSVEGLSVAFSIQQNLTQDAEITVWDQGVFELSKTTIESLLDVLGRSDFGIFVFSPDDITTMRKQTKNVVRDNVLFEFGLFIGKLGRERVFFIFPTNSELHLPSDLMGITAGRYDPNREDKSLQAATAPACHQIRLQTKKLGLITVKSEAAEVPEVKDFPGDKIEHWTSSFLDGEYSKAKEMLEKVINDEPEATGIADLKGWLAYCQFKIDGSKGIEILNKLLTEYEQNIEAFIRVASIYFWEHYVDKAIEVVSRAIEKFGKREELVLLLAECFGEEGGDDKALNFLLSNYSEDNINITLKIVAFYNARKEFNESRKFIHRTYLRFPNNEKLRFNYAMIALELQENCIAIYLLDSLITDHPKNSSYLGYYSNCCVNLNFYDDAMVACQKANDIAKEKEPWLISNIGNMLKNKGFYTQAISYLEKSLLLDKESDYAHDRLATSLKSRQEEREKIKRSLEEGRRLIRQFNYTDDNLLQLTAT